MQHSWRPSRSIAVQRCPRALFTGLLQADAARAAGIATGARDRHGRRTRCRLGRSGVARTDERCSNRARRVRPPLSSPSRSMRPRGCRLGRIIGSVLLSERASTQTNKQTNRQRHRAFLVQLRRAARLGAVARAARVDRRGCARRVHARRLRAAIPHAAVRRCMHQACARAGAARRRRGRGRRRREGVEFEARRAAAEKVGAPLRRLGLASCARAGAGRRGNGSRAPLPPTHARRGARARPPCDGRACYACRHARRCRRLMHEVIARHVVEAAERVRAPAALLRAASKR